MRPSNMLLRSLPRTSGALTAALLLAACGPEKTASTTTQAPATSSAKAPLRGNPAPAQPGVNVPAIKVDTVGYPSNWQKVAIFNVDPQGAVIKNEAGEVVHTFSASEITDKGNDRASQDHTWHADFSKLTTAGTYVIESGDNKSDPFSIGNEVYDLPLMAGLKAFYFQRTRTALVEPYAKWEDDSFLRPNVSHAHEDVGWDIEDYPDKKKKWEVEAGWHDAGNYDMYVPSTAPTAQALLMAYDTHPELFPDSHTNIPESGNGVPDLLDEAKWGIDWVLSVQEDDGGFRMRETVMTQEEVGSVPADQDKTVRWIDRVGSASTAKGCAMAAMTARIYAKHDPKLAKRAEKAAKKAWEWLKAHPDRVLVPPTGAAKSNGWLLWDDGELVESDIGARFNAAVQMWHNFDDASALARVRELLKDPVTSAHDLPWGGWTNLTRWGLMTLAFAENAPKDVREEAKNRLIESVQYMQRQRDKDGYMCVSKPGTDYYWGHNSNLLEKAQLMYVAYKLDNSLEWARQAAKDQWHWILGRNPNGFSMITRVGKGPSAFYHAEWGPLYPKVPPGNLIGGPNWDNMKFLSPDAPAKALLWDNPDDLESGVPAHGLWHWDQRDLWAGDFLPENSWDEGWWGVVEGDIYYNGNLTLMGAYMVADAHQN